MSLFKVMDVAGSALTAQSKRMNVVASNLANAESVTGPDGKAYRAKQVVFAARPVAGPAAVGVQVTQVVESAAPLRLVYEPNNPAANPDGYVEMPNVNVVEELVGMIATQRAYEINSKAIQTSDQMLGRLSQL